MKKIITFLFILIMTTSCSNVVVRDASISEKINAPDTKLCININTEESRTLRPEIAKWEINIKNDYEGEDQSKTLKFARIIGSRIKSTTFINVTADTYSIKIYGKTKDDKVILYGENNAFEVEHLQVNICDILMEDYFEENVDVGKGALNINISGVDGLFAGEDNKATLSYSRLTTSPKKESTPTESNDITGEGRITLTFTEGVLSGSESLTPGSYKILLTKDDVNLVKDPLVNIYADATTDINWKWNYDVDAIKEHNALKEVKIPVWNKESSSSSNGYDDGTFNTSFGLIGADALFAEPSNGWEELSGDFINTAYDNDGNLWVLECYDDATSTEFPRIYNIKNTNDNTEYKFKLGFNDLYSLRIMDFEFIKIDETEYVLLLALNNNDTVELKIIELSEDLESDTDISSMTNVFCTASIDNETPTSIKETPTSILVDGTNVYIATNTQSYDDSSEFYIANVYKGVLTKLTTESPAESFTLTVDYSEDDKTAETFLSLNINNFIDDGENYKIEKENFKISDMYIKDSNTLYITANCFFYSYEYSGNYSFGGLFKYSLGDDGTAKLEGKYGIDSTKFTETVTDEETGEVTKKLCDNIMQAENKTDLCFAGPRYIIPTADGKKLFIVDSGFYGSTYTDEDGNSIFSSPEERSRIFTFDTANGTLSCTDTADGVSFDFNSIKSFQQV